MSRGRRWLATAGVCLATAACIAVAPSPSLLVPTSDPQRTATPSLPSPTLPEATQIPLPAATPNGTISIECFPAFQWMQHDLRQIGGQAAAFPIPEQIELMRDSGTAIRDRLAQGPAGCLDRWEPALRELARYLSREPARTMTVARIDALIAATGMFPR